MKMKREEMNESIASLQQAMWCARIGRIDDMILICDLARIGAAVLNPTEDELRAMVHAIQDAAKPNWCGDGVEFEPRKYATAALLALKPRT